MYVLGGTVKSLYNESNFNMLNEYFSDLFCALGTVKLVSDAETRKILIGEDPCQELTSTRRW